jgi:hypothetical protein
VALSSKWAAEESKQRAVSGTSGGGVPGAANGGAASVSEKGKEKDKEKGPEGGAWGWFGGGKGSSAANKGGKSAQAFMGEENKCVVELLVCFHLLSYLHVWECITDVVVI